MILVLVDWGYMQTLVTGRLDIEEGRKLRYISFAVCERDAAEKRPKEMNEALLDLLWSRKPKSPMV